MRCNALCIRMLSEVNEAGLACVQTREPHDFWRGWKMTVSQRSTGHNQTVAQASRLCFHHPCFHRRDAGATDFGATSFVDKHIVFLTSVVVQMALRGGSMAAWPEPL